MCATTLEQGVSSPSKPTIINPSIPSHRKPLSEQSRHDQGSSTAVPNTGHNPSHGAPREDQVGGLHEELAAATAKLERIRSIRREKKLRANALQKPRCDCTEGCHCMRTDTASCSSGEGQSRPVHLADISPHLFPHGVESPEETQTSSTVESRRRSSDVSSDGRQHSPSRIELAGIGDRFSSERRRSGGRVRPVSSLSQAPTAVSNGSSISLLSGPAYIYRRPPGSRPSTPRLRVSHNGDPDPEEDGERGGPTPTQSNITTHWSM